MISEQDNFVYDSADADAGVPQRPTAQGFGPLPAHLVATERAAAALRDYLTFNGLGHYRIFYGSDGVYDIDEHLAPLGEASVWEPIPPMIAGGEVIDHFLPKEGADSSPRLRESGILRLATSEVVLARWQWLDDDGFDVVETLWLSAAPSLDRYATLRERVLQLRRTRRRAEWQVVRGYSHADGPRLPRDESWADDLIIAPALRQRLDTDVVGFFEPDAARMYRSLSVAYRRGVLMHGPPGNGKTSLIRYIGARLLDVPAMLLRPTASFDTDDLEEVLRRWREQAPAILVIEDLDWLLKHINVSTLLNLLDGVDSNAGAGGLLLIATTNNPHELDPAINNRPGRFDVVIEIDRPDDDMRLELLRRKLPEVEAATLDAVAEATDGLSFAQVMEVLRLSGFAAIAAGRSQRTEDDLLEAAKTVSATNEDARRGFPIKPDAPFGLARR
jgi:hypothetical protein